MANKYIGIGLRSLHLEEFSKNLPDIGWVEIHSENYMQQAGASYQLLQNIAAKYPISLHGIGMSLGSARPVDQEHLAKLKNLIQDLKPFLISEHLSWSASENYFVPDLISLPLTKETLEILGSNISYVQDSLQCELLIENPSTYFEYNISEFSETEFLNKLCQITGAKILLDVNNVYVSSYNNDFNPYEYITAIKPELVREIHLAGHTIRDLGAKGKIIIDSHNNIVAPEVWQLYKFAISRFGNIYTLLEWDSDLPNLAKLINEAQKAECYLQALNEERLYA